MSFFIGILAGMGLPMQTSINTNLRRKVRSPYRASLVSFLVALAFLAALLLLTGQGMTIPFQHLLNEPIWIWLGGICGVVFLTGNIHLFDKLGGVQTVILPVVGQILMGLLVDHFGLFRSSEKSITIFRILGAALVVLGVVIVSTAKQRGAKVEQNATPASIGIWLWRIFAVIAGMLSATQTAVNGYLGKAVESPVKAAVISFIVGSILLAIVCLFTKPDTAQTDGSGEKGPWWMWVGGILGGIYILANVFLSRTIGTGMTVIVVLIGSTTGGLLIDQFGVFRSPKRPTTARKVIGACTMIVGAAIIRLL